MKNQSKNTIGVNMKKYLIIGSVTLVALLALGAAGFAYAQAQNPPTAQPPAGNQTYQNFPFAGMMRGLVNNFRQAARAGMMAGFRMGVGFGQGVAGPMHDDMIEAAAGQLGLSVEDLQAKLDSGQTIYDIASAQGLSDAQIQDLMEKAHDAALDAMVAAGIFTQEQADAMDQHMESTWQNGAGGMMSGFQGQRPGIGQQGQLYEYRIQAYAQATGLTVEQVETRLNNGETLWQMAESQGMTLEQFRTKLAEAVNNVTQQALADGKITQAQADWLTNWANHFDQSGFGPGTGMPGGFGRGQMRMMPGMRWNTQP
jgi:uncharacterized protein YidB (DUF937 family)